MNLGAQLDEEQRSQPFLVSNCSRIPLPVVVQSYVPSGWSVVLHEEIARHLNEPEWLTLPELALELTASPQELEEWAEGAAPTWERQLTLREQVDRLDYRLELKQYEDRLSSWRGPRCAVLDAEVSRGDQISAENLTEFMRREGLTARDVANATGWSSQAVRTWIEGRSRPSSRARESLLDLLEGRTPFFASKPGVFPPRPKPARVQLVMREELMDLCRNLRRHSELSRLLSVDLSLIGRWATGTAPRFRQHALRALLDQMRAVELGELPLPDPPKEPKRRLRRVSTEVADLAALIGSSRVAAPDVAMAVGVSEKTVLSWLRGIRTPSAWSSGQLRRFLDSQLEA